MLTAAGVPPPSADEAAQSARVAAALRERLAASGGWIPFSAFMETALYEPGLGYYMTDRPLFGGEGDYVTAPGLSPLFAACVANGLADLLEKTGGGDVLEYGAGDGRFAQVAFAALLARGAPAGRYRIVEPSPALAEVIGSKAVPRTEVTKRLWAYIKKNKLQDAKNKRMINADATLKAVFGGKSSVNMFEMTKLVGKHLK